MAFEKNICELGKEYSEAAGIIRERISRRLARLRTLRAAGKLLTDEAYILKSELSSLYREYNDTLATAAYLSNYYDSNQTVESLLL